MSVISVTIPITGEIESFIRRGEAITLYAIPLGSTLLSIDKPKPGDRAICFTYDDGKNDCTVSVGVAE
jgi:hypothetical protein